MPEEDVRQHGKKEGQVVPLPEIPQSPLNWLTKPKFAEAVGVAAKMFADKTKKGSCIPYISHLLGTCAIALEHGATEDEAIAALLHDTIEDIKPTDGARAAVGHFGKEVLRIVGACSDSDTHPKPPWQERKERYLDRLAAPWVFRLGTVQRATRKAALVLSGPRYSIPPEPGSCPGTRGGT